MNMEMAAWETWENMIKYFPRECQHWSKLSCHAWQKKRKRIKRKEKKRKESLPILGFGAFHAVWFGNFPGYGALSATVDKSFKNESTFILPDPCRSRDTEPSVGAISAQGFIFSTKRNQALHSCDPQSELPASGTGLGGQHSRTIPCLSVPPGLLQMCILLEAQSSSPVLLEPWSLGLGQAHNVQEPLKPTLGLP